jgi:hypothetical protein
VAKTKGGGLAPAVGRTINPALFAVVVGCFFLPFFSIQCTSGEPFEGLAESTGQGFDIGEFGDEPLGTVSGWQLVIGDPGDQPEDLPGQQNLPDPEPDPFAMAAFIVAVLAIPLTAITWTVGSVRFTRFTAPLISIAAGIAIPVMLFIVRGRIEDRLSGPIASFLDLQTRFGFWLAGGIAALAAAFGGIRLALEREPLETNPDTEPIPSRSSDQPAPP